MISERIERKYEFEKISDKHRMMLVQLILDIKEGFEIFEWSSDLEHNEMRIKLERYNAGDTSLGRKDVKKDDE